MTAPAPREAPVAAIGITIVLALFGIAFMWMFRPSVGGCAALPPGGGCFSYTESRIAIGGTIAMVILGALFAVVAARVAPPRRTIVLIVLGVLMLAVVVADIALSFTNPLYVPEGVFP